MVKMTKSKTFQAYLPNCHRTYSCIHCRAHLANHDELISKASGLFRDLMNYFLTKMVITVSLLPVDKGCKLMHTSKYLPWVHSWVMYVVY